MAKTNNAKRVNIDIDKRIWQQVGVKAAKDDATKREIVESALKKYLTN